MQSKIRQHFSRSYSSEEVIRHFKGGQPFVIGEGDAILCEPHEVQVATAAVRGLRSQGSEDGDQTRVLNDAGNLSLWVWSWCLYISNLRRIF